MAPNTKIPARDWVWEFDTTGNDDWVEIGGLSEWGHSPKSNDADATTFDNDGRLSHFKASRGDEFSLKGLRKLDVEDGTHDPGQAAVEALGALVGPDSLGAFRLTDPSGENVWAFDASATVTFGGGKNDDATTWEAALVVDGAVDTGVSVPAVPGAPSGVAGTNGNTVSVITWTAGTGSPTEYEVEVSLSVGGTVVGTAKTTTTGLVYTGLTNSVAYKARVRAKNAGGWGAWTALSSAFTPTA